MFALAIASSAASIAGYVASKIDHEGVEDVIRDFKVWKINERHRGSLNLEFADLMSWISKQLKDPTCDHRYFEIGRVDETAREELGLVVGKTFKTRLHVRCTFGEPPRVSRIPVAFQCTLHETAQQSSERHSQASRHLIIKVPASSVVDRASLLHELRSQAQRERNENRNCMVYTHTTDGMWTGRPFNPSTDLSKLALDDSVKRPLTDSLQTFYSEEGRRASAAAGDPHCLGIMLHGPSGTGKTETLVAISKKFKLNAYCLDLSLVHHNSQLQQMMLAIRDPAIVVIEDIERMVRPGIWQHSETGSNGLNMTLSSLLNVTDGFLSHLFTGRIFAITTNNLPMVRGALTRAGRMDLTLELSYLSATTFAILARIYRGMVEEEAYDRFECLPWAQAKMVPAEAISILKRNEAWDTIIESTVMSRSRSRQET